MSDYKQSFQSEEETKQGIDGMNETKHTPGPWERQGIAIGSETGSAFDAICYLDILSRDREQREANARLIAAAPDLLAALEGMLARYASHESGQNDQNEPAAARAAIAKATGGE